MNLNDPIVGKYLELYEIDGTGIGMPQPLYFATTVTYDKVTGTALPVVFGSQVYQPAACKMTGVTNKTNSTSSTPSFTISNVDKQLWDEINKYEGLRGAKFKRRRTFIDDLSGGSELTPQNFIIAQVTKANRKEIVFKLNIPTDFEGVKLPLRRVLKDVGFPGVSRRGSRV